VKNEIVTMRFLISLPCRKCTKGLTQILYQFQNSMRIRGLGFSLHLLYLHAWIENKDIKNWNLNPHYE